MRHVCLLAELVTLDLQAPDPSLFKVKRHYSMAPTPLVLHTE